MARKIHIVGIGDDGLAGLTQSARQVIGAANLVIGTPRTLAMVDTAAPRWELGSDLSELVRRIEADREHERLVVLAPGDPLFFGVARYLIDRLGKDLFEVVPHVSTMQLAFARVMESWDEAYLTDVSQHPIEHVLDRIRTAEKVGIFTSAECGPNQLARALLAEGIDYFRAFVCENLGSRNEVVTRGKLTDIAAQEFSPLNVMILVREPQVPDRPRTRGARRLFGNPDEVFRQSRPKRGLLTPAEVRTLALAELSLCAGSVVWDVGAGSGSVSMEAAQLASSGTVYAIEPDGEDCALIRDNASAFGIQNVRVVQGRAPEVFDQLPDPDCVFVGGIAREGIRILDSAFGRLQPGGRLVANFATLESLSAATAVLRRLAGDVGILMVNLARGIHQLESIRFEALNPTFLVFVRKDDLPADAAGCAKT